MPLLIIDAHSFPSRPRAYELNQSSDRPEICIGTDERHTSRQLAETFINAFRQQGFSVQENAPFNGSIVPQRFYRADTRVQSVMVEVNRSLYMDEKSGARSAEFWIVVRRVRRACYLAAQNLAVKRTDQA